MDALCFVLGKLGARSMRAGKSANLIFNGGKEASPMKEAEVSIYFDNASKVFPLQGNPHPPAEVKISRIIRQNGTSVYKINDETRTRQQVLELLAAAKIDPDGHNIILQGDIIRFTDMHPEERRQLIEEISGISMYEDKKQRALNELARVEAKLNEATIILNEREVYLRELKKDRDQAMKYKDLESNIKSSKATYLHHHITEKEKRVGEFDERIKRHEEQKNKVAATITSMREKIQRCKDEIERINRDIEEKSERESVALQKEIDGIRTILLQSRERSNTVQSEIEKMGERKRQLEAGGRDVDATITRLETGKKELEQKHEELQEREKEIEKKLQEARKRHLGGRSDEGAAIDQSIVSQEKRVATLQEEHHTLLQKKFSLDARLATIQEKIREYHALEKELDREKLKREYAKIEEQLGKTFIEESSCASQVKEILNRIAEKERELLKCEARESGILESVGYDKAVETILSLRKKPGFDKSIYGTISQLGRVEEKFATALEVAAGQRMKSILVDTDQTAAACIALLKEKKSGIATFLPLNKITGRRGTPVTGKGVYGQAVSLVSFDPKFKDAFSYAFGDSIIVHDIATARRVGIGRARMVTLEGDSVERSGAMTGGHRIRQLQLHFQEKKATRAVKEVRDELTSLEKSRLFIEKRKEELEAKTAALRKRKSEVEGDLVKGERSVGGINISALKGEEKRLKEEKVYRDCNDLKEEIEKVQEALKKMRQERSEFHKTLSGVSPFEKIEEHRSKIREQHVQVQTELRNIQLQIENIYMPEKEKTKQIMKQYDKELASFMQEEKNLAENIKKFSASQQEMEKKERKFKQDYKELFNKRNKTSEETHKAETAVLGEEGKVQAIQDKMNALSIDRAKVVAEKEALEREYGEFGGVELRKNISIEKLKEEIKKFEQMLGQIGNVNMRALEVYEDIKKEYDSLLEKAGKLQQERDDVVNLMYEIDSKKKESFMGTFKVIAQNFTFTFSQLSRKGEASLALENKDDPLQGGVDIMVRITGNRYMDIKSLSGGEKTLAALAFIFAIQDHHPAPFYLLDEVDAALDKTNSDLLSKLIAKYSSKAQYVLISHNDMVISEADTIYGVSMQENGMSKVISLKV